MSAENKAKHDFSKLNAKQLKAAVRQFQEGENDPNAFLIDAIARLCDLVEELDQGMRIQ